jgi:ELWxxDGT repeat protein
MRMRLAAILCSVMLAAAAPAFALEPYMVKDISPSSINAGSDPREFISLENGIALFLASIDLGDRALWRSDGTAAGTYQLTDPCEGWGCSTLFHAVAVAGDRFFFMKSSGRGASELWVTGGTAISTFNLGGPFGLDPYSDPVWVKSRGLLFFLAEDGDHGLQLWRSDGTAAGTYRLTDFPQFATLPDLVEFRGKVYFQGRGARGVHSLWTSDGTPKGTKLVKDVGSLFLRSIGSALVFFGPGPGVSLWRSDGTAKGTAKISTVVRDFEDLFLLDFVALAGRYYFTAQIKGQGEELWGSDGTPAGTRRLTNFANAAPFLHLPTVAAGSRMVFAADDGVHGAEPWITDGTPAGTRLLRDVCPGTCGSSPEPRAVVDSRLIFAAITSAQGQEPWVTNGTAAGTRLLRDICPGACHSSFSGGVKLGQGLIFRAGFTDNWYQAWKTDGTPRGTTRVTFPPEVTTVYELGASIAGGVLCSASTRAEGAELWRTDGTVAGTHLLRDVRDQDLGGSKPYILVPVGNRLFFYADDDPEDNEIGLWSSDGTGSGTFLVHEFATTNSEIQQKSVAAGDTLFLLRSTGGESELWRTDEGGLLQIAPPGLRAVNPPRMEALGNRVYFLVQGPEQRELWMSDGTVAGTRQLSLPGSVTDLAPFQGRLFFNVGPELWARDETTGKMAPLVTYPSGSESIPGPKFLGAHGGRLWYESHRSGGDPSARMLWSTDGTAAGTTPHPDFPSGISRLISAGSRMFLTIGGNLWVSDGTAAGTRRVPGDAYPSGTPVLLNGRLFYWQSDGLWSSDGTAAGTKPVLNAAGERLEWDPSERLAAFGGHVYFVVSTEELWRTDGSPAGTVKVGVRFPRQLTPAQDRLFFSGWDPAAGQELWALGPQ